MIKPEVMGMRSMAIRGLIVSVILALTSLAFVPAHQASAQGDERIPGSTSALHSIAWSPSQINIGGTSDSVLNGGATFVSPVYVCFRWNRNGVFDPVKPQPGSTSWAPSTATHSGLPISETQEWIFEVWTNQLLPDESTPRNINQVPTQTICDGLADAYQPDITASLLIFPTGRTVGTLTPSSESVEATVGTAIDTGAFTNNSGGSPTFSVSPALPNGLSLDPQTGAVTGTPTTAIDSTVFTIRAELRNSSDQITWEAFAQLTLAIEDEPQVDQSSNTPNPGEETEQPSVTVDETQPEVTSDSSSADSESTPEGPEGATDDSSSTIASGPNGASEGIVTPADPSSPTASLLAATGLHRLGMLWNLWAGILLLSGGIIALEASRRNSPQHRTQSSFRHPAGN